MEANEEPSIDGTQRYRKFGLPNWMVNNIERLNFATDFEQYACSPPETDGFLSENIDNCDFHDPPPLVILNDVPDENLKIMTETKSSNLLAKATEQVASLSVVDSVRHEDFYSSPDSTPCATPEPSPAPRRKMSGQQDTVQTNPGRWFYLGNLKKPDPNAKAQGLNINSNKKNRMKNLDKSSEASHKLKSSPVKPKKDRIKLVISNFDINAVSPTSW